MQRILHTDPPVPNACGWVRGRGDEGGPKVVQSSVSFIAILPGIHPDVIAPSNRQC